MLAISSSGLPKTPKQRGCFQTLTYSGGCFLYLSEGGWSLYLSLGAGLIRCAPVHHQPSQKDFVMCFARVALLAKLRRLYLSADLSLLA